MAIFSRRHLQRMLDENAKFVGPKHLAEQTSRLNRAEQRSLDAEWEVAILNALSRMGEVQHERDLGGTKYVDVHFRLRGDAAAGEWTELAADIATVHDGGFEDQNPLQPFVDELVRRVRKAGLDAAGFRYDVDGHTDGRYRDARMRLALPPRSEIGSLFGGVFVEFLEAVRCDPRTRRTCVLGAGEYDLRLTFEPGERFLSGGYPSYAIAYSKTRNPVHNALKRKADQLRGSAYDGPRGVILCDGGCQMLRQHYGTHDTFGLADVVGDFMRQEQSVEFVIAILVTSAFDSVRRRWRISLETRPFLSTRLTRQGPRLATALMSLAEHLPRPVRDGTNACNWLASKERKVGQHRDEMTTDGRTIRMSARRVLEMLAGRQDPVAYFDQFGHPFPAGKKSDANPFAAMLENGRLISAIRFEPLGPDADDDQVVIEFGGKDPAVSRFTCPPEPPSAGR